MSQPLPPGTRSKSIRSLGTPDAGIGTWPSRASARPPVPRPINRRTRLLAPSAPSSQSHRRASPSVVVRVTPCATSATPATSRLSRRSALTVSPPAQGLVRGKALRSSSSTSSPAWARSQAAAHPAGPAPTMMTSACFTRGVLPCGRGEGQRPRSSKGRSAAAGRAGRFQQGRQGQLFEIGLAPIRLAAVEQRGLRGAVGIDELALLGRQDRLAQLLQRRGVQRIGRLSHVGIRIAAAERDLRPARYALLPQLEFKIAPIALGHAGL